MKAILPERNTAVEKGWIQQVQWVEDRRPCFARFTTIDGATNCATRLQKHGLDPIIFDLRDELQLY